MAWADDPIEIAASRLSSACDPFEFRRTKAVQICTVLARQILRH
jgi:hypothetical protein